jgi:glycolate oxidase iron-sulfur subunit
MTVCPLYQSTSREADVARGKLALLEMMDEDTINRSKHAREILSRCLLCGACRQACANSVQTTDVIQRGRQSLFKVGTRWFENPLVKTLRKGGLSGPIAPKGGALFQALCCKRIPENSGLHLRFPLSFFTQRLTIPAISWTPFIKAFRKKMAKDQTNARVGLFVGCGANYLFSEAAWAFVRLFQHMGIQMVVPQKQACCGMPAFVSGDNEKAIALAKKNIEAFGPLDLDAVLTLCASCGSHLGDLEALFEKDDPWRLRAKALAAKHKDAMAFLIEDLDLERFLKTRPDASPMGKKGLFRVGYHDPCHLRIGQGGTEAPRQILNAMAGVELIEKSQPDRCCGHGGGFNLLHYGVSMKLLDRRMASFQQKNLDAIASGCTGCLLQLAEGIARHGVSGRRVEVLHPLIVVDRWLSQNKLLASI